MAPYQGAGDGSVSVGKQPEQPPLDQMIQRLETHIENVAKRVDALTGRVQGLMPNVPTSPTPERKTDRPGSSTIVDVLGKIDERILEVDDKIGYLLERIEV